MNFRRWAFALILMPVTALIATPAGAKLIKFTIDR
jgi:hypothetical protein